MKTHTNIRQKLAAITTALVCFPGLLLSAETAKDKENEEEVLTLDAVNVTAMRESKPFIETPATTFTFNKIELQATGSDNALDALRFADGMITSTYGGLGQSYAGMFSRTVIRGSRTGTLILLDGLPAVNSGNYNMEDIPMESIGRIEIVKGGGSVMYGSSAIGGVINIIADNSPRRQMSATRGGNGYENYSLVLREAWSAKGLKGTIGITGVYKEVGEIKPLSSSRLSTGDAKKRVISLDGSIENWKLLYQYSKNEYSFNTYNTAWTAWTTRRDYVDEKHFIRASGSGKNWRLGAYTNIHQRDGVSGTTNNSTDLRTYGADFQYDWKPGWADFILGVSASRDEADKITHTSSTSSTSGGHYETYSAFASGSKEFFQSWTATASIRETYVSTDDMKEFIPQFQLLKTLPHKFSVYASVSRVFNMPTVAQLYMDGGHNREANPGLQPEKGWNYEAGVKWEGNRTLASLSVFYMDMDHIGNVKANPGDPLDDTLRAETMPFRNTGVELSLTRKLWDCLEIGGGAIYNDPKQKEATNDILNDYWTHVFGRVQLTGRIRWSWDRYFASFNMSYLGKRSFDKAPLLQSTAKIGMNINKDLQLSVTVENVFDRIDDPLSSSSASSTKYYTAGRWAKVNVTVKF